ncbi:hypothetical protein G9A89_011639 [Geosiphon pyriformis]|nr:hypothetical protein G9A89_011639 [Geosiphon pyriformis]
MSNFHTPKTPVFSAKLSVESTSFTILPQPFPSVLVISAAQHQQAQQRVIQIDQEVRSAGVKIRLIESGLSEEQKKRYPSAMEQLTPFYAKINKLVPFYYLVSKNSDKAARDLLTMKYILQQQFIALPEDKYIITLEALQHYKKLLEELAKMENQLEKLLTSGGYAACQISFFSENNIPGNHGTQKTENHPSQNSKPPLFTNGTSGLSNTLESRLLPKPSTPPLPPLKAGASTLARFLSLVENSDPLDDTSNRVGDLFVSTKKNFNSFNHNHHHEIEIHNRQFEFESPPTKKNNVNGTQRRGDNNHGSVIDTGLTRLEDPPVSSMSTEIARHRGELVIVPYKADNTRSNGDPVRQ